MEVRHAEIQIKVLDKSDDLTGFECGDLVFDKWLVKRALQNQEEGFTQTFCAFLDGKLIGFYSLCQTSILNAEFFGEKNSGAPGVVPCVLLARIAVHKDFQSNGIGKLLLRDAFKNIIRAHHLLGGHAILIDVDQNNRKAINFYKKYGFQPIDGILCRFYLPIKTLLEGDLASKTTAA